MGPIISPRELIGRTLKRVFLGAWNFYIEGGVPLKEPYTVKLVARNEGIEYRDEGAYIGGSPTNRYACRRSCRLDPTRLIGFPSESLW